MGTSQPGHFISEVSFTIQKLLQSLTPPQSKDITPLYVFQVFFKSATVTNTRTLKVKF